MRIMGLTRGDADSEANVPPTPELMAKMGELMEEVAKAGVLVGTEGLKPTSESKRVKLEGGNVTVTDGPFTESKEVIASYALFQVDNWDEAVYWTKRFLEVLGRGEVELRPLFEAEDFSPDLFPPEEVAKEEAIREQMQRNAAQ
jgi:hypothetical protein